MKKVLTNFVKIRSKRYICELDFNAHFALINQIKPLPLVVVP